MPNNITHIMRIKLDASAIKIQIDININKEVLCKLEQKLKRLKRSKWLLQLRKDIDGMTTSYIDRSIQGDHNLLCNCHKCLPSIKTFHKKVMGNN